VVYLIIQEYIMNNWLMLIHKNISYIMIQHCINVTVTVYKLQCSTSSLHLCLTRLWFCTSIQGLRPELPKNGHPKLLDLMQRCWEAVPSSRPSFNEIRVELENLLLEVEVNYSKCYFLERKRRGSISCYLI